MTTHAPARGQRTGQQQRRTSEKPAKVQTSLSQGQQFLDTVNTIAKLESRSKRYRDVTGDEGNTAEGFVGVEEDDDDDQELHYLQEDEEIGDGPGVYGEDEDVDGDPYPPEDGSEEGGAWADSGDQEDDYAGNEPGVDDVCHQEAYYSPGEGSGDGATDYEYPEQEDEYADREPGGDDEGDQDAYYPQDDDDGVEADGDGDFGLDGLIDSQVDDDSNDDDDDGGWMDLFESLFDFV